jgi:hypothetical protein
MTLRLNVKLQNLDNDTDTLTHISEWSLSKEHEKVLTSIVRQMFEHPNTKYSSKLRKMI